MAQRSRSLNLSRQPRPSSKPKPPKPARNLRRGLPRLAALCARGEKGHCGTQARQEPLAGARGRRRNWKWRWKSKSKSFLFVVVVVSFLRCPHAPLRDDGLLPGEGSETRRLRGRERRNRRRSRRQRDQRRRRRQEGLHLHLFNSPVAPTLLQARALPEPRGHQGRLLRPAPLRESAGRASCLGRGRETASREGHPERPSDCQAARRGTGEIQ